MKLLLDTQIFLYFVGGSTQLTKKMRDAVDAADEVFVSAASIWEAAIKHAVGKLNVDVNVLVREIEDSGFTELPIRASHAAAVSQLPMHHRDPFDRLLVAQAISEPLQLATTDRVLRRYSDLVRVF
jgi:PIN domain nuclease of toxin-antitoxin system